MKRTMILTVTAIVTALSGIGYLGANYYSVLAEVRESFATVDTTDAYTYGETLFVTRSCVACHTLDAAGSDGDAGPHLTGIGARADEAYIRESIVSPNAVIAANCPEEACEPNVMPPYGSVLDDAQVDALVVYLSAQQ